MKKIKKKLKKVKKINKNKILVFIEEILDHKLFRPVAISIIASFFAFKVFSFINLQIIDYKEFATIKRLQTPIKIEINDISLDFNSGDEKVFSHKIQKGDTILQLLVNVGVSEVEAFKILLELKKKFDPRYIVGGNKIKIGYYSKIIYESKIKSDSEIKKKIIINYIEVQPSIEEKIVVYRLDDGSYKVKKEKIELLRYVSKFSGDIETGLFNDGARIGVSANSMMNMINIYSYDVDFQRDIRKGDKFELLVESFYSKEGKKIKDGNILYASLTLQNRELQAFYHEYRGIGEYFDEKGDSIRKSLLRTPINGARISSGFGVRRHPVLGYSRMHKGIDFAARRGTPILAAGSGRISYMGRYGSYGNYVRIRHNSEYSTAYAHASRFNRKFRKGSRVKQGDVVAYVGTTGRSTGPHLHYEVLRYGKQINPSRVKSSSGVKLKGKDYKEFLKIKKQIEEYRKNIPNQSKA